MARQKTVNLLRMPLFLFESPPYIFLVFARIKRVLAAVVRDITEEARSNYIVSVI